MDIVLVANSPGELSALVKPIAKAFKEKLKDSRIILFLTPCQYASGKELEFARKNLAVDEIVSSDEYKKWLFGKALPFSFGKDGICLFLGGDLMHVTLIAKKLNYKAYAYLSGNLIGWTSFYKKFFIPDNKIFKYFMDKGVPSLKLKVAGDLMTDQTTSLPRDEARAAWHLNLESSVVAFMPGSRKWEIDFMLPLYERIGKILKKENPELKLILIVSQFVSVESFFEYKEHHIFDVFANFESLNAADLVVTIPGTNTAQIAALGLPMLVVFPLDRPEVIPLEGILHYIINIPVIRYPLKRFIAWLINKKTKFFALPNIKANREIVREIRGKIDPQFAAEVIALLLKDKARLAQMSKELKEVMGEPGAAGVIVGEILNEALS
jgi:lipid-A-disaccharide synthase